MTPLPSNLRSKLELANQTEVLRFWDQLSESEQQNLEAELAAVDFKTIQSVLENVETTNSAASGPARAETAAAPANVVRQPQTAADRSNRKAMQAVGEQLLADGKVAVITVAGGQGSRLGFDHPKGMFPIGPVTDRTLFQIFAEQILARQKMYDCVIPWLIMTSSATHDETVEFFDQHSFFGLSRDSVKFFQQGSMPAVDASTGKLLLKTKSSLCLSPDGHGGLVTALKESGLLGEMKTAGIQHFFYHQVDNPTAILCDPELIGLHHEQQSELTTNVVEKSSPTERMGVLVDINGHIEIIEYSELTEAQAAAEDATGQWIFWAGNTAIHVVRLSFFDRLTADGCQLELHLARKKMPHLDSDGKLVEPTEANAYKFERFIFDALPLAENALIVEGDREREFNPVKNATGSDSPQTAKAALQRIAKTWLKEAGQDVPDGQSIELSPLVAVSSDQLQAALQNGDVTLSDLLTSP
ncbi:MAG: UDPGP type 1 family protein [Fuerstiella sp.]